MNIFALDLATKTGWAHTDGSSGVFRLPDHAHRGARWGAFSEWLDKMLMEHPTDRVVFEQAHHRGGPSTRFALALVTETERIAAWNNAEVKSYHTATIKKHATGSGRATKDEMLAAAIDRNPNRMFEDDNEVDALFLLDLAISDS
jgi:Holliday junction resolvasome RuvABC endonuclease subunit